MESLNQWGIAFILWIQSLNPALDAPFRAVNFLQTEEFFLVALPIVFWCFNKRIGAALAILFLTSDFLVRMLKSVTAVPRPYDMNPSIRMLDPQPDFSFPSAGTMDATIFWAFLAIQFRKRALWIWAIFVICLVGFTRVYLGAHYPVDVFASLLIASGILFLVFYFKLADQVASLARQSRWVLAVGFPIVLGIFRLNPETAVTLGAMLGFGIGVLFEAMYVGFEPRTQLWKQGAKLVIGLAIGLALRIAIKPILPTGDVFTLARYAIIGLWMGVGAPWLFVALRLARGMAKRDAVIKVVES